MPIPYRAVLAVVLLGGGLGAEAALEKWNRIDRPPLVLPLASLPLELGDWVGRNEPVDAQIIERAQTTEYINRNYESPRFPGLSVRLWINYSRKGDNLRHTPTICLPSTGWNNVESLTRTIAVPLDGRAPLPITRLGYERGELVLHIGFWYYIFGEGRLENYVRSLPITSRSSHGRTTRGSSMTIEVFYLGESDPQGIGLRDFAAAVVTAMDPILPGRRANYFIP